MPEQSKAPNNLIYLFYVWGHSYEFDRNNNWEVIENPSNLDLWVSIDEK